MLRFSCWGLALLLTAGVWLSPLTRAYYGTDDRQDIYQLSGENLTDADSVVALFPDYQVQDLGDGTSGLLTVNYGEYYNLCPSECFREQPSGSFCSGVLVAPDVIATAAHCITGEIEVQNIRFVFGYRTRDETTPELVINNSDIYHGVEVIAWQQDDSGTDWALIRLDGIVVNHRIAQIREAGTISDRQALHIIGHPKGLPAKFASGGTVRENRYRGVFIENLDAYGGNSGSSVFNSTTHVVEGLHVAGKKEQLINRGIAGFRLSARKKGVVVGSLSGQQSLSDSLPGCNREGSTAVCKRAYSLFSAVLLVSRTMSERNPMYQHPEWDLPGVPKALIGAEPVPEFSTDPRPANDPQPETKQEKPLDTPSLIRLFQTDAYPLPEGQPVRITVGTETSLTCTRTRKPWSTGKKLRNTPFI
jgi:hypothetical protein